MTTNKKHSDYALHTAGYREGWRIFKIMSEFVEGYELMTTVKKEVTFLGSARTPETDKYYQLAVDLGEMLSNEDYSIITGGGPGIMEAGNRGAKKGKGTSIGLNIELPFEQHENPYLDMSLDFNYFFTRKVMLTSPAHAFVYFPGGFGTMDEFFEVVDHIELGKMCQVPIVLVGREYWEGLIDFLRSSGCTHHTISEETIANWNIVDTAAEAFDLVHNNIGMKATCELSTSNFHSEKNVDWRIFRIMSELVEGFEFLAEGKEQAVSILGTKSVEMTSAYYESAQKLGAALAEAHIPVVTGGAPGIAEAANKGATEKGGVSMGLGMKVRGKARMNDYVNRSMMFDFPFTRKLILTAPSRAFVFYPGGLGTMHQLFELLTLIQTEKIPKRPIILVDLEFWGPLDTYIRETFITKFATISVEDEEIYTIVDSVEEVMELIGS